MTSNWIADNKNAPAPPAYFLQAIYDYDAMLVVMPSRDNPGAYVIARRKQFGKTGSAGDKVGSAVLRPFPRGCAHHVASSPSRPSICLRRSAR